MKNYEAAENKLKQAAALDDKYANALYNLGVCYMEQEQLDEAEIYFIAEFAR